MTIPRMATSMAHLWQGGIRRVHRFNERTHGWLGMLAGAAREALKPNSAIIAAAIAYFALFSLFPLALLSISIASFILGPLMDQQLIVRELEFIAPALGQLLGKNIDEIIQARGPVSSIAIVGLIWSASTIFYTLTITLNGIWSNQRNRPVWKRRGLAILFVLFFVGPARMLRIKDYKGQPVYKLAILDDIVIIPGDSGGGNWLNGKLVGNTWASYINTIKLPNSPDNSLVAPLPLIYLQAGEFNPTETYSQVAALYE